MPNSALRQALLDRQLGDNLWRQNNTGIQAGKEFNRFNYD
jgi:hypothetical protein